MNKALGERPPKSTKMTPRLRFVDLIVFATILVATLCHNIFVGADGTTAVVTGADGEAKDNRSFAVSTKSAPAVPSSVVVPTATAMEPASTTTTTAKNGTIPSGFGADMLQNRGMIVRMTYVLVGFSILILVYFVVKAVRLRRIKSRTRKYGVLTENLDSPLSLDDESDEEVEVFEVNGTNLRGGRGNKGGNTAADRLLP